MPDADKVYGSLDPAHQKVYKQICEGGWPPDELAYGELRALQIDLKRYGVSPLHLIKQVAGLLEDILAQPLLHTAVDWRRATHEIDAIKQALLTPQTNKRGIDLAERACKSVIHEIRQGANPTEIERCLTERYLLCVYEANFVDRIPLDRHHQDADSSLVAERVDEMRPFIQSGIEHFAKQIVRQGSIARLRRPPRAPSEPVQLNEDLLA